MKARLEQVHCHAQAQLRSSLVRAGRPTNMTTALDRTDPRSHKVPLVRTLCVRAESAGKGGDEMLLAVVVAAAVRAAGFSGVSLKGVAAWMQVLSHSVTPMRER